ncbi:hypothetical protein BEL01nite_73580 [Bradyrhizobium elkanii]|nr:hypothetical protein BEL01nite_73580 [Bradyrhizobium elkanii]
MVRTKTIGARNPRAGWGTYSRKRPRVKVKQGKNRPKMKGLGWFWPESAAKPTLGRGQAGGPFGAVWSGAGWPSVTAAPVEPVLPPNPSIKWRRRALQATNWVPRR